MKKALAVFYIVIFCALACLLSGCTTDDTKRISFSAEKAFKLNHPSYNSPQGSAAYDKYLFQFSHMMETVGIYDLETGKLVYSRQLEINEKYHCNNAAFGPDKWVDTDEFPLLYVSMENIDIHCAVVFRVVRDGKRFEFTEVQKVIYPDPRVSGVYYPNCLIDNENRIFYVMGYTNNSFEEAKDNYIKILSFPMPDIHEKTATLDVKDATDSFTLDSVTATQGAVVVGGIIYQVYGFNGSASFRIIDPNQKAYAAVVHLPNHGFKSEAESLVYYDGDFYCCDVSGQVFVFSFDREAALTR